MLKPTTENNFNFDKNAITLNEISPALKEKVSENGVENNNADKSILVILTKNAPFISPFKTSKRQTEFARPNFTAGAIKFKGSIFSTQPSTIQRAVKSDKVQILFAII